jgi:hypothetical protein
LREYILPESSLSAVGKNSSQLFNSICRMGLNCKSLESKPLGTDPPELNSCSRPHTHRVLGFIATCMNRNKIGKTGHTTVPALDAIRGHKSAYINQLAGKHVK